MKKAITFLFLVASGAFVAAQGSMMKTVQMHDGEGKSVGSIMLSPSPKGVSMMLHLTGLPAGVHAIHVHQVAKCEGPGFTTAGGHFNPAMKHHGLENPEGPHAGDIPNFTVDASGSATATIVAPGVSLGDGENSMLAGAGTAIVIHAGPDDNKSDPAGNAGGRIACGVVLK
jgi:Cu-Zn family superoxide dismutase